MPLRSLLLRRPTLPDPVALDRFVRAPGEVAGVLVGHTHFDHAVDAPAIARRFGCRAYGSDSLVTLMGLHGLAEQTVEVEPYRTYELGPFEVSFTPSVHSKLLLGLAVPYDGDLTCEHLDGLSPGAYRCGQVWGISIRVAGLLLYHQGSANLIDDAIVREMDVDVFLAGVAGRNFTRDYWSRILPLLNPRTVVPTHYDNFFRPLGQRMEFVGNVQLAELPEEIGAVSRDIEVAALPRADLAKRSFRQRVLGGDLLDRAHRAHRPGAEFGLERLQVEVGFARCRRSAARTAPSPGSPRRSSSVAMPSASLRTCLPGASGSRATWSLPDEASTSPPSNGSCPRSPPPAGRSAGRPARRSRARRPGPLRSWPRRPAHRRRRGRRRRRCRWRGTSRRRSRSSASNAARRSSFEIRRPPRFIPRRKAT